MLINISYTLVSIPISYPYVCIMIKSIGILKSKINEGRSTMSRSDDFSRRSKVEDDVWDQNPLGTCVIKSEKRKRDRLWSYNGFSGWSTIDLVSFLLFLSFGL